MDKEKFGQTPELDETTPADKADENPRNVLGNAIRRVDNGYHGIPNDESLIGKDLPEEEDEDADDRDPWDDEEADER